MADLVTPSQAAPGLVSSEGAARRPRVFFGWWIVGGAIIAQFVAFGLQAHVAGVFLGPMTEELGWTRSEYTSAASLGTVLMGVLAFLVGSSVDRRGARALMVLGATVLGATLLAFSRIEELWEYLLLRGVLFTVGNVLIGNLVVNVTISKWFVERRGRAISLASLGVSASSIVVAPVMTRVVDSIGWRDGWLVLGLATWALVYPVSLVMKRRPEDSGRLPDGWTEADALTERGRAALEAADRAAARAASRSLTRSQALQTRTMWLLIVAFGLAGVGLISLFFHFIPFLTDAGYTRGHASLLVATQGVAALLSRFAWGGAMRRMSPRGLAAVSFVISGAAAAGFVAVSQTGALLPMYALFFFWGWGVGGLIPLSESIWASYLGRPRLQAVRGVGVPSAVVFTALLEAGGLYFAAAYYDALGSYDGAILTFAALWLVAAVLVLSARRPAVRVVRARSRPAALPSNAFGAPRTPALREPSEVPSAVPPAEEARAPVVPPRTPALGEPIEAPWGVPPLEEAPQSEPRAAPAEPELERPRRPQRSYMGGAGPSEAPSVEDEDEAGPAAFAEPPLEGWALDEPPFDEEFPDDFSEVLEAPLPRYAPGPLEAPRFEDRAVQPRPRRDLQRYRRNEVASAVAIGVAASVATTAALWLIARWARRGGAAP